MVMMGPVQERVLLDVLSSLNPPQPAEQQAISVNAALAAAKPQQLPLPSMQAVLDGAFGAHDWNGKDTGTTNYGESEEDEAMDEKTRAQLRREKNRVAARKCRQKKTAMINRIQADYRQLVIQNHKMQMHVLALHSLFAHEIKVREDMKQLINVVWNSSSLAEKGPPAPQILESIENGSLDFCALSSATFLPATQYLRNQKADNLCGGSNGLKSIDQEAGGNACEGQTQASLRVPMSSTMSPFAAFSQSNNTEFFKLLCSAPDF